MKNKRATALALLLVMLLSLLSLASCKEKFTDEEIISSAKVLVENAEKINDIFFGKGIPYTDEGDGNYKKADEQWLSENGIQTIQDLKNLTTKIYSPEFSEYLFEIMLGSVKSDSSIASYASYVEKNGEILVFTNRTDYIQGKLTYDKDGIKVEKKDGASARVSIPVIVENEEGEAQSRVKSFDMVKIGESWFLNSGTFLTYNNQEE